MVRRCCCAPRRKTTSVGSRRRKRTPRLWSGMSLAHSPAAERLSPVGRIPDASVKGQWELPSGGHETCPLAATRVARWWPWDLRGGWPPPAPWSAAGSRGRRGKADLAPEVGDLGESSVSRHERAAKGLGNGKIGGVVAGDVAAQLPRACQQRCCSDKVDGGGHHRSERVLSALLADLLAEPSTADGGEDFHDEVFGAGPVRIAGELGSRASADRPVVGEGVGQHWGVDHDHLASASSPLSASRRRVSRSARAWSSASVTCSGGRCDPSWRAAKRSNNARLVARRASSVTSVNRKDCNDCPRAAARSASVWRMSSGTSRI